MARHLKRKLGIAAGTIAAIGLAWFVWNSMKPTGPGAGFISGNGRIEATEIDISTTLAGRVIEISVNEGDIVVASPAPRSSLQRLLRPPVKGRS